MDSSMGILTCNLLHLKQALILLCVIIPMSIANQDGGISKTIYFKSNDGICLEVFNETYPFSVYMDETSVLKFSYYHTFVKNDTLKDSLSFKPNASSIALIQIFAEIDEDSDDLLEILNTSVTPFSLSEEEGDFNLVLKGKLPGRAELVFRFADERNMDSVDNVEIKFKVFVEVHERVIDKMFTGTVIMLVVLATIGMGAKVDIQVVRKELKRPVGLIIGMCCQYIIMPLIAFTFVYNMSLDPGIALGFFALGCSPGGSASNAFTYLLKGNVSLSVTMTLISSVAALGALPLWLFTLGPLIYSKGNITIPYANIIFSLIGIVAPIGVGLFLQWKLPKVADFFIKAVKYIIVVFFIFVMSVGIYTNYFVFLIISWPIIIAAACLPYLGFAFGAVVAYIVRQPKANIIAIAVETGIQNTGIPIILLRLSLSGPDKYTSIVMPVMSAIFTPIPIMCGIAYVQIKDWLRKRNEKQHSDEDMLENEQKDSSQL